MQSRYKISRELAQTSAKFFKTSRGPASLCLSLDTLGASNFPNSNLQKVWGCANHFIVPFRHKPELTKHFLNHDDGWLDPPEGFDVLLRINSRVSDPKASAPGCASGLG